MFKIHTYKNLSTLSRNYVFVRDMKNCGDTEMNKLSFLSKTHTFSTLIFAMTKSLFFDKIGML